MTIAIGILASDGVVIAADREEGDSYLKNETGKCHSWVKATHPLGAVVVTGAGWGSYLDEVSQLLIQAYCDPNPRRTIQPAIAFSQVHREYYNKTVLPFAYYPLAERPDYSLIIACHDAHGGRLWSTSGLAFKQFNTGYCAVGAGDKVAIGLLNRLYSHAPIQYAIKLAAYVVYQVKASAKDCGLGTDIIALRDRAGRDYPAGSTVGQVLGERIVSKEMIREWENLFRSYIGIEKNSFEYCIGLEGDETWLSPTTLVKKPLSKQLSEMRKAFARLDDQWSKRQK